MSPDPADPAQPRATRREWLGLCVIALPCLLYSMDLSVLHLAAPALTRDLQPSGAELLWIVDICSFMVAGWLVTMGTLGDRIGRRKLLMGGGRLLRPAKGRQVRRGGPLVWLEIPKFTLRLP